MESILYLFNGSNNKSGYLLGPWTPVYGIGIVFILIIYKFISKHISTKKHLQITILFFTSAIIISIVEWLGGNLIEFFFHYTCWDYSNLKFHIGKYTALELSFIWGLLAVFFILFLKKITDKIIIKIPKYITYGLTLIFIIDNIFTIMKRIK